MSDAEVHVFYNRSYIDFYPIQFGKEVCEPLHSFGPSIWQHYIFHYIISGKGTLFITESQQNIQLKAGQGFLIPPNSICSYEADENDPWTYMWVEFDGLKTEHFLYQAGLNRKNPIFNQKFAATESIVYEELDKIIHNKSIRSANIVAHLYLFMDALIETSLNQHQSIHMESKEFYIREAINFIERNFSKPITVSDIAHYCNLEQHYFSRLFKEQISISPQQFLIHYRLSHSCELLENPHFNLATIAEKVGYSNQFNFSAAFKKKYGKSPQQWRKERYR